LPPALVVLVPSSSGTGRTSSSRLTNSDDDRGLNPPLTVASAAGGTASATEQVSGDSG
jgi:hypothetical protein